jgi:hypothetical protein
MLYRPSVTGIDLDKRHVRVGLSKRQTEDSPPIGANKPVARQREIARMPDDGVR